VAQDIVYIEPLLGDHLGGAEVTRSPAKVFSLLFAIHDEDIRPVLLLEFCDQDLCLGSGDLCVFDDSQLSLRVFDR